MLEVLKKIPQRVYMVLTRPEHFFKKIVVDGSMEESMVRAFIYGLIGGLALIGINLIGGGGVTFGGVFVKLAVFPLLAVVVLFVFAGLMMLTSEITGGSRDWELAVKGVSSIFFIYPVVLILNSLAWGCTSLWFIGLLVDGYVLFLLYNVAYHCMGGKKRLVLSVIMILAALLLMAYISEYSIVWLALKNPSAAIACLA